MATGEPFAPPAPRVFLDDPDGRPQDRLLLRGSAAHRVAQVLRMRRGDALEVVDEGGGRLFSTAILRVAPDGVEVEIVGQRALSDPGRPLVTLLPALIRPTRFDWMLETVTELGVDRITPVRATRSLASGEGHERAGRWRRLVTEASEQNRRERRPVIHGPLDIEKVISAPPEPGAVRILASAAERSQRVADLLAAAGLPARVEILVGPEGGFTEPEFTAARQHGWQPVTLGPRPLRPETAAIVAVAVVQEALAALRAGLSLIG